MALGYVCMRATPLLHYQDSIHYANIAKHLAQGQGFVSGQVFFPEAIQPPLSTLLVAAGIALGLYPLTSLMVICLLCEGLVAAALVRIHVKIWGRQGAVFAAVLAATYANAALGAELTMEPVLLATLAAGTLLLMNAFASLEEAGASRPIRTIGSIPSFALAGGAFACGLMARPEAIIPMAFALVVPWFFTNKKTHALISIGALAAGMLLVVIPYGFWVRTQIGVFDFLPKIRFNAPIPDILAHMKWLPEQSTMLGRDQRVLYALMPDHQTMILNHTFLHPGFDPRPLFPREPDASGSLVETLRLVYRSAKVTLWMSIREIWLLHPIPLLLMTLGLGFGFRTKRRSWPLYFASLVVLGLVPAAAAVHNIERRYLATSLFFAVPLLSGGAVALVRYLIHRGWKSRMLAPGVAAVLAALFGLSTFSSAKELAGTPRITARMRDLERICVKHIPPGARVLADHSRCAFFADAVPIHLPYVESLDELTAFLRNQRITHAVFDTRTLAKNPSAIQRDLLPFPERWPASWKIMATLYADDEPIRIVQIE